MSVYSGFATRDQETKYNNYVYKMLLLLEKRILWMIKEENYDKGKWINTFEKLIKNMISMEKSKYLPPKFSHTLVEMVEFFGIKLVSEPTEKPESADTNSSRSFSRSKIKPDCHVTQSLNSGTNSAINKENRAHSTSRGKMRINTKENLRQVTELKIGSLNYKKMISPQSSSGQTKQDFKPKLDAIPIKECHFLNAKKRWTEGDNNNNQLNTVTDQQLNSYSLRESKYPTRKNLIAVTPILHEKCNHSNLRDIRSENQGINEFFNSQGGGSYFIEDKNPSQIILKPLRELKTPKKCYQNDSINFPQRERKISTLLTNSTFLNECGMTFSCPIKQNNHHITNFLDHFDPPLCNENHNLVDINLSSNANNNTNNNALNMINGV